MLLVRRVTILSHALDYSSFSLTKLAVLSALLSQVSCFGFNFESLTKSVSVAKGFTNSFFDSSMKMSPARP